MPSVPKSSETRASSPLAQPSFVELVAARLSQGVQGFHAEECGLLNRLDTGTSGILLFAKSQAVFDRFRKMWKENKIEKVYQAIATDVRTPKNWVHSLPIDLKYQMASSKKSKKRVVAFLESDSSLYRSKIQGKVQSTHSKLLTAKKLKPSGLWLLKLSLVSGYRHQLRAHLAQWGLPLAGDPSYGTSESKKRLSHFYLHASHLKWTTDSGDCVQIECPCPSDWENIL